MLVVDVPELRTVCEELLLKQQRSRAPAMTAMPVTAVPERRSMAGTLALVLLVLTVFGVAAWVLWQRAGGAGS